MDEEKFSFDDVVKAMNALATIGVTPYELGQVSDCRATAFRVALALREAIDGNLHSTIFEVTDIPVLLTEWARSCYERQGFCYISITPGNGTIEGKWIVELLVEKPTFNEDDDGFPNEQAVIFLHIKCDKRKAEFDRILRFDHPDVQMTTEDPSPYQPPDVTILKLTGKK